MGRCTPGMGRSRLRLRRRPASAGGHL